MPALALLLGAALALHDARASDDPPPDDVGVSPDQARIELRSARPVLFGSTSLSFDACGPSHWGEHPESSPSALSWLVTRAPRDEWDVMVRVRDILQPLTFRGRALAANVEHELKSDEDPDGVAVTLRLVPLSEPTCLRVFQADEPPAAIAKRLGDVALVWIDGIDVLPATPRLTFSIEGIPVAEALALVADAAGVLVRQRDEARFAFVAKPKEAKAGGGREDQ